MSIWQRCMYWILNYQFRMLQNKVIKNQDTIALRSLLDFPVTYTFKLPISEANLRSAIFAIDSWEMEDIYQDYLFNSLEDFLFDPTEESNTNEWQVWLRQARNTGRQINVRRYRTGIAIYEAYRIGKLNGLANDAQEFLSNIYAMAYPKTFRMLKVSLLEATPILIEYPIQSRDHTKSEVQEWVLDCLEQIWQRRFVVKPDVQTWIELKNFLAESNRPVPVGNTKIRDALFSLDVKQVKLPIAELYIWWMEEYLFHNINESDPHYWHQWIQTYRQHKEINEFPLFNEKTATNLKVAFEANKLTALVSEDYIYLSNSFYANYSTFVTQHETLDSQFALKALAEFNLDEFKQAFPLFLNYISSSQHNELASLILSHHQETLENNFVAHADTESLTQLLRYVINYDREFPIAHKPVQTTLFSLNTWQVADELQGILFACIEGFLFNNISDTNATIWQKWLNQSREINRPIKVASPTVANALAEAYNAGMLVNLPREDYLYLLKCYRQEYGDLLAKSGSSDAEEALPLLLELAAITQMVGANDSYDDILEQWAQVEPHCPRSLASLTDIQSYQAPIFGIGSPHRTSITIIRDLASPSPVQIVSAGTTGDATMNARIFNQLFASALACNSEPTLLTTNGSILSLQPQDSMLIQTPPEELRSVVIGPAGPVPPTANMPTLGISAEDAMLLITGSFEQDQTITDLVRLENADKSLITEFERRVQIALHQDGDGIHNVEMDDIRPPKAGITTAIPLIHRDLEGNVVPIEIEIPYSVLGAEQVFTLLQATRAGYIKQLITGVVRRQRFAENQAQEQERLINWWKNLPEMQKTQELLRQPKMYANVEIDFKLGIIKKLNEPVPYDRDKYETEIRDNIRHSAIDMAQRFAELAKKLEEIDRPYGLADTLSFKLLVDAMIRKGNLPIPHVGFQSQYKEWVRISHIPVWTVIKQWAEARGLSPEILAADNVLFNVMLPQQNLNRIIIQPWTLIDLHDGIVQIDHTSGLIKVTTGNTVPTLYDAIKSTDDHSIDEPKQLYDAFREWFNGLVDLPVAPDKRIETLESRIQSDKQLYPLVMLEWAKRNLLNAQVERAVETLDAIHEYNMAPIYFWRAVAYQYQFIEQHSEILLGADINALESRKRQRVIWYYSFLEIVNKLWKDDLVLGIDKDAAENLAKLLETDNQYSIANYRPADSPSVFFQDARQQISAWETFSLRITPDQKTKINAIANVLDAAKYLSLAEEVQSAAKELPFNGGIPASSRQAIDKILNQLGRIDFGDANINLNVDALYNRYTDNKTEAPNFSHELSPFQVGFPAPSLFEQEPSTPKYHFPQHTIHRRIPNVFGPVINKVSESLHECCGSTVLLSNSELKNVFAAHSRLKQWASGLVETWTEESRIYALIDYLFWRKDGNENGLALFLNVVSERVDEDCSNRIRDIAKLLKDHLSTDFLMNVIPYNALDTSRHLIQSSSIGPTFQDRKQNLDVWDIAAIKRHLHVLSESIAGIARGYSDSASYDFDDKRFTFLLSLAVDLRWHRGYSLALDRIGRLPLTQKPLAKLCELIEQEGAIQDGVLSTVKVDSGDILIRINDQPAILVKQNDLVNMQAVYDSVNDIRILRQTHKEGESLRDRIGQISITTTEAKGSDMGRLILHNREALIPLISRLGIPEAEWLLPDDENYPAIGPSSL